MIRNYFLAVVLSLLVSVGFVDKSFGHPVPKRWHDRTIDLQVLPQMTKSTFRCGCHRLKSMNSRSYSKICLPWAIESILKAFVSRENSTMPMSKNYAPILVRQPAAK